jgi:hypothetical protein
MTVTENGVAIYSDFISTSTGGIPADITIYDELDPRLTETPVDVSTAYEQAIYLVALAARRADARDEHLAQENLLEALTQLETEKEAVSSGWLCSTTGFGCETGNSVEVLSKAMTFVIDSHLNQDDTNRIKMILARNIGAVKRRQLMPWALLAVAAAGSFWFWKRSGA